jgi:hypothetical protein
MNPKYNNYPVYQIAFENFWDGFNPEKNFLSRLFELAGLDFVSVSSGNPDSIIFTSHFKPENSPLEKLRLDLKHFLAHYFKRQKGGAVESSHEETPSLRIFYTGENYRTPRSIKFSLSHDLDDYGSRNIYYPYLFDHLLISKLKQYDDLFGEKIEYEPLFENRIFKNYPKKFACIFFANDVPLRRRLVDEMSKYGKVDVFGKANANYIRNRSELFGQYRYVLCPENDHFPGYVTEKILHAYAMGAVPIYWGGLTKHQGLNPDSMIRIKPDVSLELQIARIANLQSDAYKKIYMQRLMLQEPNWLAIVEQILGWINSWRVGSLSND